MKSRSYRDHRDMMASILGTINRTNGEGAKFSRLIFSVETAWNTLLPLLDELEDKEMIVIKTLTGMRSDTKRHMTFFITVKGIKFLNLYTNLKDYLSERPVPSSLHE